MTHLRIGNAHHDFGLAVRDRNIGRLHGVTGRRFDHGSKFLDRFGCLGPERVGAAIGRERGPIELCDHVQRRELADV